MNVISGIQARPKRVILYGQEGVGKTTFISKIPGVLFADTEDGTSHLAVDRVPVKSINDLRQLCGELIRNAKKGIMTYKVLAIDTADRLWEMCSDELCAANGWDSLEALQYNKCYRMVTDKFIGVVKGLDHLIENGISVIIVCHCKVERMSPPDLPEYTMYQPKVSAPGKQAEESKEKLKQWGDSVLFCHYETAIDRKTGKATGAARRVIETVHTSFWEAKYRGSLPAQLEMDDVAPFVAELGLAAPSPVGAQSSSAPTQQEAAAQEPQPQPRAQPEPEAARGADAVPPSGAHPAELGFDKKADPEHFLYDDEQYALLVRYFVAKNELQPGQTLDDLRPAVKKALRERPKAAEKRAREWAVAENNKHVADRAAVA